MAQPRQQHDPDGQHHQPDPEGDPRIGGLVDWREVGGPGPGGHRQCPDEARERCEAGPSEPVDEAVHAWRGYRFSRYCSNVVAPSLCSGVRRRPSANWRLNLNGSFRLTSRLREWRAASHGTARLPRSLTSGPPKSGSNPPGSLVTTPTRWSATSAGSMGWKRQFFGTSAKPGGVLNADRKVSMSEWNWVARRIVQGTMFSRTTASAS